MVKKQQNNEKLFVIGFLVAAAFASCSHNEGMESPPERVLKSYSPQKTLAVGQDQETINAAGAQNVAMSFMNNNGNKNSRVAAPSTANIDDIFLHEFRLGKGYNGWYAYDTNFKIDGVEPFLKNQKTILISK